MLAQIEDIARAAAADKATIAELQTQARNNVAGVLALEAERDSWRKRWDAHNGAIGVLAETVFKFKSADQAGLTTEVASKLIDGLANERDAARAELDKVKVERDALESGERVARLVSANTELKKKLARVTAERDQAQSDRQKEHEKRVHFQGSLAAVNEKLNRRTKLLGEWRILQHNHCGLDNVAEATDSELATDHPAEQGKQAPTSDHR